MSQKDRQKNLLEITTVRYCVKSAGCCKQYMPVPKLHTFELEPWQPRITQKDAFVQSSGIEMGIAYYSGS